MAEYFITIAGNIGVGKSTLTGLLADRMKWEPIYEAFTQNPYLTDFYQDMQRWGFHSQVFFLSRRLQQHHDLLQRRSSVIQDRSVYEDAEIFAQNLFRQGHLSDRDWNCYMELYETMATLLRPPDLVVYLQATVETLRRRISHRGREYEKSIDDDYLIQLNKLYDEWANNFVLCPVLTIDTNKLNYIQYDDHLELICHRIEDRLQGRDYLALI